MKEQTLVHNPYEDILFDVYLDDFYNNNRELEVPLDYDARGDVPHEIELLEEYECITW